MAEALWGLGLAPLYISGPEAARKLEEPLQGVRLILLDMVLDGGGTSETSKMSTLAATIKQILDPGNGPYVVVAWTAHPDLVTDFEEYLVKFPEIPQPVEIFRLAKGDFKHDGVYDAPRIMAEVAKNIEQYCGLKFLTGWEEQSFLAASQTVHQLSALASPNLGTPLERRTAWDLSIRILAYSLARQVAGATPESAPTTIARGFFNGLAPLHSDRLEAGLPNVILRVGDCSALKDKAAHTAPTEDQKASINTMLHCSFDDLEVFRPGNVYLDSDVHLIRDPEKLASSFFKDEVTEERRATILTGAIPVVVEANAVCDHANEKVQHPRLIPGYFVTVRSSHKQLLPDTTAYLWRLGYLRMVLDGTPRNYTLLLNLLHLDAASSQALNGKKAVCRLRSEALSDLLARLGQQVNRPGKTLL